MHESKFIVMVNNFIDQQDQITFTYQLIKCLCSNAFIKDKYVDGKHQIAMIITVIVVLNLRPVKYFYIVMSRQSFDNNRLRTLSFELPLPPPCDFIQ